MSSVTTPNPAPPNKATLLDMSLSKLREIVKVGEAWLQSMRSQKVRQDLVTEQVM